MTPPGETGDLNMRILYAALLVLLTAFSTFPSHAQEIGSPQKPIRVMLIPADGGTEDGTKADFQPLFDAITRSSDLHFTVSTGQSYAAVIEACARA